MKNYHAAGAGLLLFAGGLMIGREVIPNSPPKSPPDQPTTLSTRLPSKRRIADTPPPASTDTTALLNLVNNHDTFGTNRALGKTLEKLDAGSLLTLLQDLEASSRDHPKFHTARIQIFNHLALADPSLALETLMGSDDKNFTRTQIGIVIRYLAKEDFSAARAAVNAITDKTLLGAAQTQLLNAAVQYAPDSIPELLEDTKQSPAHLAMMNYGSWQHDGWGSWGHQLYYPTVNQNSIVLQWAQKDPAAAEAYALTITDPNTRAGALSGIASIRAQTNPDEALAWAENLATPNERNQAMTAVLRSLASKDPQRVAGMLDGIDNPQIKQSLITTVAHQLLSTDRAAGLAWIDGLPGGSGKSQALNSAIGQIAREDPRAAASLLDKLPPNFRKNALSGVVQTWAQNDLEGAKTWVTTLKNPFDLQIGLSGILGQWALQDPVGAAQYLDGTNGLPNNFLSNQFGTVAAQWAARDPDAALQWAHNIEDKEGRQRALSSAYHQWATKDPSTAAQKIDALATEDRGVAISAIISNWTSRDPQAAMQWVNGLSREERVNNASTIIGSLAHHKPLDAAAWLEGLAAETAGDESLGGQVRSQASSLVSTWSNNDVEAAAHWAQNLADDQMREGATQQVAQNWARSSPIESSEWIDNLPAGEARDQGVRELANQFKQIDPATAFEWSQSVSDDSNRIYSMREVLGEWKKVDIESAREAYSNSNLTEKQREQLDYIFKD